MKMLTVKQVAKISGVSVRALHHYDEIGLLKPARIGRNRYRYYGDDELLRLQQILLHRELDIPLERIREVLDDPKFDQRRALVEQRDKLARQARRYAQLVRTIDRTIARLNGEKAMRNAELYKGISPEKQAEYEVWLARYRQDGAIEAAAILAPKEDHLLIWSLAVAPACKGRGIGSALMDFAEYRAALLGLATVRLYTNALFVENIAWYQRRGYQIERIHFIRQLPPL